MQIALYFKKRIPPEIGSISLMQRRPNAKGWTQQVELPMAPCPDMKRQMMDTFWTPRGIPGMLKTEPDQILCLMDDNAYIESDRFFLSNFAGLQFVFKNCIETNDPSDCASEAEAREFWRRPTQILLQIGHEQLDMKNQEEPLSHMIQSRILLIQPSTKVEVDVFFSPNSFTDNTDAIGIFESDLQPIEWLSVDEINEVTQAI